MKGNEDDTALPLVPFSTVILFENQKALKTVLHVTWYPLQWILRYTCSIVFSRGPFRGLKMQ